MTKVGTQTVENVLKALKDQSNRTAKELGVSAAVANALVNSERPYIEVGGTRKHVDAETGKTLRGRPSNEYKLTRRGRDKARRLATAKPAPVAEPVAA